MSDKMTCPECQGEMVDGNLVGQGQHNISRGTEWVEGPLESSSWSGAAPKNRARFAIAALRCSQCGYVKLFADRPAAPPSW
jgi:hypothetical protein